MPAQYVTSIVEGQDFYVADIEWNGGGQTGRFKS